MTEDAKITTWIRAISEATADSVNLLARHLDNLGRTAAETAAKIEQAGEVTLNLEEYRNELVKDITRLGQQKALLTGEVETEKGRVELLRREKEQLERQIERELENIRQAQNQREKAVEQCAEAVREAKQLNHELLELKKQLETVQTQYQQAEEQRSNMRQELERLEREADEWQAKCDRLRAIYAELEAQGRPLKPYEPSERLPRMALKPRKFGTSIPEIDYRALQLLRQQAGQDINSIVVASLRNYISHEYYRRAVVELNEETADLLREIDTDTIDIDN